MRSTILFKDDHFVRPETRKPRHIGANDNFRSLEFELEEQERDWRLLCLIATIVTGLAAFVFLPLW